MLAPRTICVGCQYRDRPQELQHEFENVYRSLDFARETLRDRFAMAALVMHSPEEAWRIAEKMLGLRPLTDG